MPISSMARGAQIVMTIDSSDDESLDDDDPFRDNVTVFTPIMDNVDVALHLTRYGSGSSFFGTHINES